MLAARVSLGCAALFFDFDGTLAPIAATPDAVRVAPDTLAQLERVQIACNGAVAIITGRPVEAIDTFLAPLRLPIAGLHGAQWRTADGARHALALDPAPLAGMADELEQMFQHEAGVLVERKGAAIALHYRNAPHCETMARQAIGRLLHKAEGYVVQPGKMVLEVKPRGANKGAAVAAYMQQAPFAGRCAVFAGDDLTDEDAFRVVNELGGVSIKVGPGDTVAQYRLADPQALAGWLAALH